MASFYPNPEPVFAAAWALVSALPDFQYVSRRWKHWSELRVDQQPALMMVQRAQNTITYDWRSQVVPSIRLFAEFVIYSRQEETLETSPASVINNLVYAVTSQLEPNYKESTPRKPLFDPAGAPLAYNVRIADGISIVEGVGGDNGQSIAFIPIEIIKAI
jgi:hypothetical protein